MSAAIRHLSVRVPWHDRAWDGHVCNDPLGNSACLALKLVAERRKDAIEAENAGAEFDSLSDDNVPPCVKASAAFLSPRNHTIRSVMEYSTWSEDHKHIQPKAVHLPAYGALVIPYRWMLKETGFELAAELELPVNPDNEPQEPMFLQNTAWLQHHNHQKALLDAFVNPIKEKLSLVFFYATRTPLCDDERRVLLGAALLEKKHDVTEYEYAPAGPVRSMVWERAIQHSLRPNKTDDGHVIYAGGFLLPYHELQRAAAGESEIDVAQCIAFVPEDARAQFSYGSEQVTHGAAAAALLAAKASFEKIAKVLDGPWAAQIEWIDEQLSRLWKLQGPAPGLGVVLAAYRSGIYFFSRRRLQISWT